MTPRQELLQAWADFLRCFPEVSLAEAIDTAHDLPAFIEDCAGVPPDVPVFIRSRRNETH